MFKVIFSCFVSVCILYCYTVFLQRKVTYTNIQYAHTSVCVSGDLHLTWSSCFNPMDSWRKRGTMTWFSPSASSFPCRSAVFGTYLFTICVFVSCSTGSCIFRDGFFPLYVAALYKHIPDSNSAVSELRALPSPCSGL